MPGKPAQGAVVPRGDDSHVKVRASDAVHEERAAAVAEAGVDAPVDQVPGADLVGQDEIAAVGRGAVGVGDDRHIHLAEGVGIGGCRRGFSGGSPADHRGQVPRLEERGVGIGGQSDRGAGSGGSLQAQQGEVVGQRGVVVAGMAEDVGHPDALPVGAEAQVVASHHHIHLPGLVGRGEGDAVAGGEHPPLVDQRAPAELAPVGIRLRGEHQGDDEGVLAGRIHLDAPDDPGIGRFIDCRRTLRFLRRDGGGEDDDQGEGQQECGPETGVSLHDPTVAMPHCHPCRAAWGLPAGPGLCQV